MKKMISKKTVGWTTLLLIILLLAISSLGVPFFEIDPIASSYNDEVFYLKQIQGIWNGLAPSGYFGYNQQTALVGLLVGEDNHTTKESERIARLPLCYGMKMESVDKVCYGNL